MEDSLMVENWSSTCYTMHESGQKQNSQKLLETNFGRHIKLQVSLNVSR